MFAFLEACLKCDRSSLVGRSHFILYLLRLRLNVLMSFSFNHGNYNDTRWADNFTDWF